MNEWLLISFLMGIAALACICIIYPLRRNLASLLIVPLVFGLAFAGYYFWGAFVPWQDYLAQQHVKQQAQQMLKSIKSPQELIEKLRMKLDDTPKSAKGWYLLGRLYSGQNEKQEAVAAFAKAQQLSPDNEQFTVNYAHSLWQLNHRQFNEEISAIFTNLLKKNPQQPDALAMLAMAAYEKHDYETAIALWQRLLRLTPEQSEEATAIRQAIVKAEERIKLGN